jgi:hypothetical protein
MFVCGAEKGLLRIGMDPSPIKDRANKLFKNSR